MTYQTQPAAMLLVGQTFEVLYDDNSGTDATYPNVRVFYVASPPALTSTPTPLVNPQVTNKPFMYDPPTNKVRSGYVSPEVAPGFGSSTVQSQLIGEYFGATTTAPTTLLTTVTTTPVPQPQVPFVLDGRYLRVQRPGHGRNRIPRHRVS